VLRTPALNSDQHFLHRTVLRWNSLSLSTKLRCLEVISRLLKAGTLQEAYNGVIKDMCEAMVRVLKNEEGSGHSSETREIEMLGMLELKMRCINVLSIMDFK
jgi:hypothetical protein